MTEHAQGLGRLPRPAVLFGRSRGARAHHLTTFSTREWRTGRAVAVPQEPPRAGEGVDSGASRTGQARTPDQPQKPPPPQPKPESPGQRGRRAERSEPTQWRGRITYNAAGDVTAPWPTWRGASPDPCGPRGRGTAPQHPRRQRGAQTAGEGRRPAALRTQPPWGTRR